MRRSSRGRFRCDRIGEDIKIPLMRSLLREKFVQEPERSILLATGDEELIEGNWWHDTFWGQCPLGTGENWLGRLLMEVRADLCIGLIRPESEQWTPP